jgi:flavin reductase (DIM6/NTAB) family NADH-FMN oxidoreductase RutF
MLIADGDPGRVLGLIDEESELWDAIEDAGRFAIAPLSTEDRQLADRFAGLLPAPGGPFGVGQWRQTDYGPVPASVATWAGCRLDQARGFGWGMLVEAIIERIEVGPPDDALVHHRARYHRLA